MKNLRKISFSQDESIQLGSLKRKRMLELVSDTVRNRGNLRFPHLYLYSPPGMGKTFAVSQILTENNINHVTITGNTSLFAFSVKIAVVNKNNPDRMKIVVVVDDCDELFKDANNCNTMKNVLSGSRILNYEKSLSSQYNYLSEEQLESIQYFSEEGRLGFSVPVDNLIFIFTSNIELPDDDKVRKAVEKGSNKSVLLSHKNAIKSRCINGNFNLNQFEHYGWLVDIILNTSCLDQYEVTESEKLEIIDFLWNNWKYLNERSIRTIEKMVEYMRIYQDNYKTIWVLDFLKINQYELV